MKLIFSILVRNKGLTKYFHDRRVRDLTERFFLIPRYPKDLSTGGGTRCQNTGAGDTKKCVGVCAVFQPPFTLVVELREKQP